MGQKTDKTKQVRKIASTRPGPEKAGVGGSTPSRGTYRFAATKPTEKIPISLSEIEAFTACFDGPQI
jgi:hypothetical protein